MNREQFIDKHRPHFSGLIADAFTSDKKGAESGIRLRLWLRQVDEELARIWKEFNPEPLPENPAANGVALPSNGIPGAPRRA